MANPRRGVVATEPHTLRLIQQAPGGTAGAYVDAVLGASWLRAPRSGPQAGLNGPGGFIQVENDPMINDASEFTITLPPTGSDGVDNTDRFYCIAGTPDPANPADRIGYYPGDEWIEIYRGPSELIAVGTPINVTAKPEQIEIQCRDVLHALKKTRETASGFWQANSPRDVFEYYTRLWKTVVADDFATQSASFTYSGVSGMSPAGSTAVRIAPAATGQGNVTMATSFASGAFPQHGAIRLEAEISSASPNPPPNPIVATVYLNLLGTGGTVYTSFAVSLLDGSVFAASRVQKASTGGGYALVNFPTLSSGASDQAAGKMMPPYTLATEIRERWAYFYLNGQLVAVTPQPNFGAGDQLVGQVSFANPGGGTLGSLWVDVDSLVCRRTTNPLNAGQPGDYVLPSPPEPGGLIAEYYDLTQLWSFLLQESISEGFAALEAASELAGAPTVGAKVLEGTEMSVCSGFSDTVLPSGLGQFRDSNAQPRILPYHIRRAGAIYLPLGAQDVHFTVAVAGELLGPAFTNTGNWPFRLYVGKTRRGEEILAGFYSDGTFTGPVTSVGMRSLLGTVTGWYPIIFEICNPQGGQPPDLVLTWDGPGGGQPSPSCLAPVGCYRGQIPDSDSNYDTLIAFSQEFPYQWKSQPQQLESGNFPGTLIPRARVGRDTDFILDETGAIDPQDTINAEDVASTLLGDASGLGGSSSGQVTAEAFDFQGMGKHPFVSQEADNIPTTNIAAQFLAQLETLLALRTSPWENVQSSAPGQRQMQAAWPPSITLPQLQEFDWQPGDGLRVQIKSIGVWDTEPRQIQKISRVIYPDGIGATQASFRPRPRDFQRTMRRFIRQVYGKGRAFQGQLVVQPGSRAVSPAYSEALLPPDLELVRNAQLYVLSKDDVSSSFDLEVNGTVVAPQSVFATGAIDLRPYVGRNYNAAILGAAAGAPEPRMLVRLINPSAPCNVSYQVHLLVLVPSA